MFNSPEALISLAEVAIAIAGFSSIVLVVKSTSSQTWAQQNTDFFTGMAVHTMFAVFFCFLPSIVNVFVLDLETTLRITCTILGAQLLLHSAVVIYLPTTQNLFYIFPVVGISFGVLQLFSFTDWGVQRIFELYLAGVIFHVLQAGALFLLLTLPSRKTTGD
jgi:hypothetical protein